MNLFVFGLGYSSLAFVEKARDRFESVAGTVRSRDKADSLRGRGIETFLFDGTAPDPVEMSLMASVLDASDAVLVSVPPDEAGDPVLRVFGDTLAAHPKTWLGYLSTVGVYGDHGGAWVDEATEPKPVNARSRARVEAEKAWLDLGRRAGTPVAVFRLSGIYGPGRNALANLASGTARRIVKPGQIFNRIHVDDIAGALLASLNQPPCGPGEAEAGSPSGEALGAIYNVTDHEPSPPQDVVLHAARLLGVEPPPEVPIEQSGLSPMGLSFYGESKRVSNRRIREELGYRFAFPTYREGLADLLARGEGRK